MTDPREPRPPFGIVIRPFAEPSVLVELDGKVRTPEQVEHEKRRAHLRVVPDDDEATPSRSPA